MRWVPRAGTVPGCRELELTWEYTSNPLKGSHVFELNGELIITVLSWAPTSTGEVVPWNFTAGVDGRPVVAWRLADSSDVRCSGSIVGVSGSNYCMAASRTLAGKETAGIVALLDSESPHQQAVRTVPTNAMVLFQCSDQLAPTRGGCFSIRWIRIRIR